VPFKSKAQEKFFYANEGKKFSPAMVNEWSSATKAEGGTKALPARLHERNRRVRKEAGHGSS
jgi:hypothetical protein